MRAIAASALFLAYIICQSGIYSAPLESLVGQDKRFQTMQQTLSTVLREKHADVNRVRRSLDSPKCHMEPIVVNFTSLGWDWILEPKAFTTAFCTPTCSDQTTLPLWEGLIIDSKEESPYCCRSTKAEPLLVIYHNDEEKISVAKFSGMVVKSCELWQDYD